MVKVIISSLRPKTLTAALVPCVTATALCYALAKSIDEWVLVFGLVSALSIQIATNLFNDALDFAKGADRDDRKGPKRLIQTLSWTSRRVMILGAVFLALGFFAGIPLVIKGGMPIVILGVVSLFLAYGYTGGPFPLAYLGLGDLFVILFFGIFAVGGITYLHLHTLPWLSLLVGLQIGLLATTLIAINNYRDSGEDIRAGKKTLAVRFGPRFARIEIIVCALLPFALGAILVEQGHFWAGVLPLVLLPAAVYFSYQIWKSVPAAELNSRLAQAGLLQLCFGILVSIGFLIS